MRIIMLLGPQDSGKTTTINIVYDELIILGAKPIKKRPFNKPATIQDYNVDFEAVLRFLDKDGKKLKIGLASTGDSSLEVLHYMSFYEGYGCDVLVCASRDYFSYPLRRLEERYEGSYCLINKKEAKSSDNNRAMKKIISYI